MRGIRVSQRRFHVAGHESVYNNGMKRRLTISALLLAATTASVATPVQLWARGVERPTQPAAAKPFHVILREAFGNNHEVVSDALFNKTVFDGKLTKEQLIVHLQQRALIHNEVHRILIAADPALHVPYGPAQKNVLVLLFTDLIDLGSGWPTEQQAMPLTRDFLKEIRESEKRGPYFALGVQHVYYGGITNGGRMIGDEIGKTLKFTPTYYEKSEGYMEYVPEIDKITDPAAQAEMIRGGQAAYRYIIAISNEPVFKAGTSK